MRTANHVIRLLMTSSILRAASMLALALGALAAVPEARSQDAPLSGPITAEIEPYGVARDGTNDERIDLLIEEEPTGRLVPLLPYIFFDEGSARIPARYESPDSAVTTDRFVRRYRTILAIVAERMRAHPAEKLVLTGTSSMTAGERRTASVARRRAEAVAAALVERYGIDRRRLVVRSRGLPERASNNAHAEGRAENRRVELSGSDLLLGPVYVADSLVRVTASGLRLVTSAASRVPLADWRIELRHDGKLFRRLTGRERLDAMYSESFTEQELRWFAADPDGIDVTLAARNAAGDSVVTPRRTILFRVERRRRAISTADGRPQDRESIVIFDFDSAELREDAKTILLDLAGRIAPERMLTVTGFTDETGDTLRNLELSQRRAESVRLALPSRVARVHGGGESGGHHWNTTPEDRFYSRVARIMVE